LASINKKRRESGSVDKQPFGVRSKQKVANNEIRQLVLKRGRGAKTEMGK